MILAPIAAAGTANWSGPSTVDPQEDSVTVTGFRVPGNATVQDGWLHVTNSPMAVSLEWVVPESVDQLATFTEGVVENGTSTFSLLYGDMFNSSAIKTPG